jgi:hypothetical protein
MITYRALRDWINMLDEDQLDNTVTVHLTQTDEFYEVLDTNFTVGDDVLDDNHPYLEIEA